MKKTIFVLILIILSAVASTYAYDEIAQNHHLLSYKDYKNITLDNIKSIKIVRYTEAGVNETSINDKDKIARIYQFLNRIQITNEANMSCTDNTTIYSITLKDDTKVAIEIECDWIVIKNKNYNFKLQ